MKAEIINYLAYLMWNILDMYIIVRYMNCLYGKMEKHRNVLYLTEALIVLFITVSMNPGKNYLNPVAITCMGFVLLMFYPPNVQKKILFSAILLTIAGFWGAASYGVALVFPTIGISTDFLAVCVCHLGFWILLELAPRLNKSNQKTIPHHLWSLLLSIPLASIGAYWCIMLAIFSGDLSYKRAAALGLPLLIILLYINLMVFFLFDRFSALINTAMEKALLEQQVAFQGQHYQQLVTVHNRIRCIHHDMKNSLQTVFYLLDNNKMQDAKAYLTSLSNRVNCVEKVISTQNPALDSVLNIKIAEIQEHHIEFFSDIIIPQGLKITFEQAVILFGNIMDNAKEEKAGVLFSSHDLYDVSEICDRVVMFDEGKKVFDDVFLYKKTYCIVCGKQVNDTLKSTLISSFPGKIEFTDNGLKLAEVNLLDKIISCLVSNQVGILDIQVKENSLYDYFKKEVSE